MCCAPDDRMGDARLFLGCPIYENEVEEMFAGQIVEERCCIWDRVAERVKCVVRRKVGELALVERPLSAADDEKAADIAAALVDGVRQKGAAESRRAWKTTVRM